MKQLVETIICQSLTFKPFYIFSIYTLLRAEFIEFCKTSHTIKNLIELESKGPRSRSGSTQVRPKVL